MSATDLTLSNARALLGAGRALEARELLERLCREQPVLAEGWFLLGAAHHLSGALGAALAAFEQACRLDPSHAQALNARASMLSLLGRPTEALATYEAAFERDPTDARIAVNVAIVLEQLGRLPQALERYAQAIALDDACLPARLNRSALYMRLGRSREALVDAERAIEAHPSSVEAHYNRAEALLLLDRYELALVAAAKVLAIDPAHVGAHFCRALTLSCLGQMREAGEAFVRAQAIDPHAFSSLVQAAWRAVPGGRGGWESGEDAMPDPRAIYLVRGMSRLARCDWRGREVFVERFQALVRDGIAMRDPVCEWSLPFATLFLPLERDSVEGVIGAVAQRVVATAPPPLGGTMPPRAAAEPLRVGYLSASFRRHPSAFLNAPIIHSFDPRRVKAHAYVLNPPDGSREAQWLSAGCALTRACHGMTDRAIAQTIRADGIHILLEVSGALDLSRPEVLRQRPAPINVAYLGALIPSGGDWIDYRIVDHLMVPPGSREFLAEKLVVLERTSCTYATGPVTPEPTPDRAAAGLPATGTVLCSFNGLYKLDPIMFGAWMRVLAGAPGSVLWLLGEGEAERNLRAEAQALGIDPARLIFAPRVSIEAHLARSRLADLFLDTLPCNAHATAAEALHCGVPVLTLPGATAAGRLAASIVHGAGLPDLVTASLVQYESTAIRLANDQAALGAIKARLEALRASSALWNARDLAHAFERAFEVMWDRHARGLEPASFDVPRG